MHCSKFKKKIKFNCIFFAFKLLFTYAIISMVAKKNKDNYSQ